MSKYDIITIGREVGSGGHEVAEALAKKMGYPLYDKEILDEASKKSGYSKEIFERHDEKPTSSFLYALAMGASGFGHSYQKPLMLEIYLAQFDTIKKLAKDGPGVFVGRCSDYVLSDMERAFHVFVHADVQTRINNIVKKDGVSPQKAQELIVRADKDRSSYYNYYSNTVWGDSRHYDLCINTSKVGIEEAADMIISCIK